MDKNKKYIIGGLIAFIAFMNFVFVPYLHRRSATKIVKTIMDYWDGGDSASGLRYFYDPKKYPPIYDLISYKIKGKTFGKKEGRNHGTFFIEMEFTADNVLPSEKTWVCEITHIKNTGWKVTDFYIKRD